MPSSRKRFGLGIVAMAVASSGISVFAAAPALANPTGTGLVINEVYGAGGNSGAVYNADYVELYNPTKDAVSLGGLNLQYRAANNNVGGTVALSGTVGAGKTFLVQMSSAASNGAALPTPDQVSSTNITMAAAGGQTILGTATTYGTSDLAGAAGVVDMVGTSGAQSFEKAAATVAATTTQSVNRAANGADSDSNATDISLAAPSPTSGGGGGTTTPTDPPPTSGTVAPIAEIQGKDAATSPKAGQTVTTQGVVTAAYPTGGFNGYYLQTGGTGGANDATPGASDAVFVYAPSLGAANFPAVGASVQVTGAVSEFGGSTQITSNAVTPVTPALSAVTPLAAAYPTTEADREAHEGELLAPSNTFTVSNTYSTNQYAEIGLATGTKPLITPTEVADAQDTAAVATVVKDNYERGVVLDDGASINFLGGDANKAIALPWLSKANPVRVGARATFSSPVILEYRNSTWKFQPRQQVTGDGSGTATFTNTRTQEAKPAEVGGDITLSSFNVLNYFTQTAELAGCTSTYKDRAGNPITANSCGDSGPRGAANAENLARQQAKIVAAINTLDASVVSLEEIENSVKFGKDRDQALQTLVTALNTAAGSSRWALVPSPSAADLPATSAQDVIRTAFIYQPAEVALVGTSKVLTNSSAFSNARQPLAQGFKAVGSPDSDAFAVVVNHFKSKGSGTDDGTGQGNSNPDRIAQAGSLSDFAKQFSAGLGGSGAVFLTGDFNAYSQEDPMQVLYADGYADLAPEGEYTYSYSGQSGSLDHVLGNAKAKAWVTGSDVWNINSGESIAFEYSRYNYNATDFYEANAFRSSDHDPVKVGIDVPAVAPAGPVDVNLLNINDFHGRIDSNTTKFATTIEQLRAAAGEGSTLFLSAGDNIGASLFASSIQQDKPAIDVLNALGLKSSAVGNHEFDQGFADLTGRVDAAADFSYLGANVYEKGTTKPALKEYDTFTINGVSVAVVGVVTQETPSLVSPSGISTVDFGDPVAAVNRVAAQLSDGNAANGEAQVIVAEYHEGAGANLPDTATCAQEIAADTTFGKIARTTSAAVDVIFTGHTHKEYACNGPVPGSTKTRPILQTGSYGERIGQVQLKVDPTTGEVTAYTQRNVARSTTENLTYPRVAKVKEITDAALKNAETVGNVQVGSVTADITTAYTAGGATRDDRASESTLGDLVANAFRDGVPASVGKPDLGIVNPGGLRAELLYKGTTTTGVDKDGVVTYSEANAVLPFANNMWLVRLTGAQLKQVLEQQWQTNADGTVPSRPYLQLGLSDNVVVTTDPSAAAGSRVTSVRISGQPLDPAKTYTVSTVSFLKDGGDNFRAFAQGTGTDTALVDRDLWISYLQARPGLAPDFARQQVRASGMPTALAAGQSTTFGLSQLDLTSLGSPANTSVTASLVSGGTRTALGTSAVANGAATVAFTVPGTARAGDVVELVAAPSRTTVTIPVTSGPVTAQPGQPTQTQPTPTPTQPSQPVQPTQPPVVGSVDKDNRKGTATLAVTVNGPGRVVLSGAKVKRVEVVTTAAGEVELKVRLTGKQRAKLLATGKRTVRVTITFTGADGTTTTTKQKVVVKKKRR
jgi:5'-nucleotidase